MQGDDDVMIGPDIITETTEKIALIRQRLAAAQSRQKKYADKNKTRREYNEGEHVFLKVSSRKGLQQSKKLGKLAPRFVGPFQILERVGPVAYRLALPPQFANMHDVFHVSTLKDYVRHPEHILNYPNITIREDVSMEDKPVQIIDRKDQVLRGRTIPLVRILWTNHGAREATWEREDRMREEYPELFTNEGNF